MPPQGTDGLFGETGGGLPSEMQTCAAIMDELTWVRATLYRWKANAYVHGRSQAEADCRRLLAFINSICPN